MTTSLLQRISFPYRNFNRGIRFDDENCWYPSGDIIFERLAPTLIYFLPEQSQTCVDIRRLRYSIMTECQW